MANSANGYVNGSNESVNDANACVNGCANECANVCGRGFDPHPGHFTPLCDAPPDKLACKYIRTHLHANIN